MTVQDRFSVGLYDFAASYKSSATFVKILHCQKLCVKWKFVATSNVIAMLCVLTATQLQPIRNRTNWCVTDNNTILIGYFLIYKSLLI
jgi:hypothetical protein